MPSNVGSSTSLRYPRCSCWQQVTLTSKTILQVRIEADSATEKREKPTHTQHSQGFHHYFCFGGVKLTERKLAKHVSESAGGGWSSRCKMYKAQSGGGYAVGAGHAKHRHRPLNMCTHTHTHTHTHTDTHRHTEPPQPPHLSRLHFSRPRSDCDLSQFPLRSGVWCTLLGDFDCRTS